MRPNLPPSLTYARWRQLLEECAAAEFRHDECGSIYALVPSCDWQLIGFAKGRAAELTELIVCHYQKSGGFESPEFKAAHSPSKIEAAAQDMYNVLNSVIGGWQVPAHQTSHSVRYATCRFCGTVLNDDLTCNHAGACPVPAMVAALAKAEGRQLVNCAGCDRVLEEGQVHLDNYGQPHCFDCRNQICQDAAASFVTGDWGDCAGGEV